MTVLPRLRGVLLTVGAALGVACLLSLAAMAVLGVRPLVVRSGSMAPTIPTGSLAFAASEPAGEARVGDVVSVPAPSGVRVMHRVVGAEPLDDHVVLTLRGDANDAPDPDPYVVDRVLGVRFHLPGLGYGVGLASGPIGRFAGGALAGGILLLLIPSAQPAPASPPRGRHFAPAPERPRGRRRRQGGMAVAAALLLVGGVGTDLARAQPALAAFADSGTVKTGTLAAYTVPAPVISSCTVTGNLLSGFNARIVWTGVTSPQTLSYSAVIVESGTTLTVTTSGTSRRVDVTTGLLGSLFGSDITVRMRSILPTTPSWISSPADQRLRVGLLGASLSCL